MHPNEPTCLLRLSGELKSAVTRGHFHAREANGKSHDVKKRARLSNRVDEFFGICPNMVSNIFTMPRTLCWLNEAPFQVNRTLASVMIQVQQQSDTEGYFRGKHFSFPWGSRSNASTFADAYSKNDKKLPACSRVTALSHGFPRTEAKLKFRASGKLISQILERNSKSNSSQ